MADQREEIGRLSRQALRLMEGAAPLVAPGGLLIAITCSLEAEENEDVMARFLATHPEFSLPPLVGLLEMPVAAGVSGPGAWRILTGGDHDGFPSTCSPKARISAVLSPSGRIDSPPRLALSFQAVTFVPKSNP